MGKHKKRRYEENKKIVEEQLSGTSYNSLSKKYDVRTGTIANWKKKYLEGNLKQDKRGKKAKEYNDAEILKKCYALLMEMRSGPKE